MDKQKETYQQPLIEIIEIEYEGILFNFEKEMLKDNIEEEKAKS